MHSYSRFWRAIPFVLLLCATLLPRIASAALPTMPRAERAAQPTFVLYEVDSAFYTRQFTPTLSPRLQGSFVLSGTLTTSQTPVLPDNLMPGVYRLEIVTDSEPSTVNREFIIVSRYVLTLKRSATQVNVRAMCHRWP